MKENNPQPSDIRRITDDKPKAEPATIFIDGEPVKAFGDTYHGVLDLDTGTLTKYES